MSSPSQQKPKLAYLFSRYPVVSQTFCDSEMLALESMGYELDIASINPPPGPFRHERFEKLRAEVFYPPPARVLAKVKSLRQEDGSWESRFGEMIRRHDREYGPSYKAAVRARNALWFAELFQRRGIDHVHVHFTNRATHTALFIKQWAGIPFSITAHAQDFMVDLGSDDLLRELCREAEFTVAVSDYSAGLLKEKCPASAGTIHRIYNGIPMDQFQPAAISDGGALRIITVGRQIEFKGFHHLIGACALLEERGVDYRVTLIGEGPWQDRLKTLAAEKGVAEKLTFAGVRSQDSVKACLQNSDVFCLPCIIDGKGASDILPTVITEAMGCSLPVVSTRLVGVPEMVVHEETGLLVEPGDETGLAAALATLAGDRELARRLGRAGRRRAESIFELKLTAAQLSGKFEETFAAPGPAPAERASNGIACLIDQWPGCDGLLNGEVEWLANSTFTVFVARADRSAEFFPFDSWPANVEYLPDALVLEAEWNASPAGVASLLEWRDEIGSAVDTEEYLRQARRALHLARVFRKRGIRFVHAARGATALTAWLLHRLIGIPFSLSIEPHSEIASGGIDRIAREAALTSRADTGEESGDRLGLRPVDRTRRLVLGPIKLRLPGLKLLPDRTPLYQSWYRAIENLSTDSQT